LRVGLEFGSHTTSYSIDESTFLKEYPERDSNPHDFTHLGLNQARLPITPSGLNGQFYDFLYPGRQFFNLLEPGKS
jgi:hypothetical protein